MATVRAAGIAAEQWGVIGAEQLHACGLSATTVSRWAEVGRLHPIHHGVYALGHRSVPIEGRLVAALLHAGHGAVLSHGTAVWWWQLIEDEPPIIDVSSHSRARCTAHVRVHHPRALESTRQRRFPLTTLARSLLDYAATAPLHRLRRAVAEADYRGRLDLDEVKGILGRGRAGSARLSDALEHHQPQLALTRSVLEERFLALCEADGIPLPEVNATIAGLMVDALWRRERVIVELDGRPAHSTPAQIERDRRRELRLRAAGFVVVRYTWRQITHTPELVVSDLRSILRSSAPSA
jgi:hypothetical protein